MCFVSSCCLSYVHLHANVPHGSVLVVCPTYIYMQMFHMEVSLLFVLGTSTCICSTRKCLVNSELCRLDIYVSNNNIIIELCMVRSIYCTTLIYFVPVAVWQDIRSLDKEMRAWDAFSGLDSLVKNMVTSLRAVGELQNPAIRDRHWEQLMMATQVAMHNILVL